MKSELVAKAVELFIETSGSRNKLSFGILQLLKLNDMECELYRILSQLTPEEVSEYRDAISELE